MKTNQTLKVDANLIREAKVLAAKQGISISRLLTDQLALCTWRCRSGGIRIRARDGVD